jgi:hypothetical protein
LPWQIGKASLKAFFSRRKPGKTDFKLSTVKEDLKFPKESFLSPLERRT